MFSNNFKVKSLGVISSISGWLTLVVSVAIAGLSLTGGPDTIGLLAVAPLYFFIGVASLGGRVLADDYLSRKEVE